jgi:hypothetical protein
MTDSERLELLRIQAKENIPKLAKLVDGCSDVKLIAFIQNVLDDYMLNVCKLGRSN